MKKRTKSASRTSVDGGFCIAMLLCLAGAAFNSVLFCAGFFRSLAKLNEAPIAEVAFTYKTARRKFLNRAVWDRLRQDAPVYNGDTIRTAQASEATILFSDGNVMELSESTMAQVFLNEDKTLRASLSEGSALIDASASAHGMSFSANGVEVSVQSGASVNARSAADGGGAGFSMRVFRGAADVSTADGMTVSVAEGEAVRVGNSGGVEKVPIFVYAPSPNGRILCRGESDAAVVFSWSAKLPDDSAEIIFERAQDRAFEKVVSKKIVTGRSELAEECAPGTHYWRLYAVRDGNSDLDAAAVGKFTVVRSPPPELTAPSAGCTYFYRTRLPAVRFVWSESGFASSYRLVVADNPALERPAVERRQDSTSAVVSTLGEGTWYWQVAPYYSFSGIGFGAPSEVGRFEIARKEELPVPTLFLPRDNSVVNAGGAAGVMFSWKPEPEAALCRLVVADNPQLERPIADVRTAENCYALDVRRLDLRDGTYYWSVSYEDGDGSCSGWSAANTFFSMDGAPEQRAVEPPDGYCVAQNLVRDMVFSWKSSLPDGFESRIRIARDKAFSSLAYEGAAAGTSMKGVNLDVGEYWWSVQSSYKNADAVVGTDGPAFETPTRLLIVSDTLDKAELLQPAGRVVARDAVPFEFCWEAVDGADFYLFSVRGADSGEAVYEQSVFGTAAAVDLYGEQFTDRALYRWEVQARANGVPGIRSRLSGKRAEAEFRLAKLRPVEITAPARNAEIGGVEAVMRPPVARWRSADAVQSAVFTLIRTDVSPPQLVLQVPSDELIAEGRGVAPNVVTLDAEEGLRPGTYEIIVSAMTEDGIDVSNTAEADVGRFSILPVPPLDAPAEFAVVPQALDAAWLKSRDNFRGVRFSWKPVPDATNYVFSISRAGGGTPILRKSVGGCEFSLDFAELTVEERRLFISGRFTATVAAERRIDRDGDGVRESILQEGRTAAADFTTAVPAPSKAEGGSAENLYDK